MLAVFYGPSLSVILYMRKAMLFVCPHQFGAPVINRLAIIIIVLKVPIIACGLFVVMNIIKDNWPLRNHYVMEVGR